MNAAPPWCRPCHRRPTVRSRWYPASGRLLPPEHERRAARRRLAFDPDAAAVALDPLLDDGEADAARFDIVTAGQRLKDHENPVMEPRRDARPVIADAKLRHAVLFTDRNRDAALGT